MVGSRGELPQQEGAEKAAQQQVDRVSPKSASQRGPEGVKHSASCARRLHHGPTCSASLAETTSKVKQHQPHCIHHNSNWHRQQRASRSNQARQVSAAEDAASECSNHGGELNKGLRARNHLADHKQPADKSYLLFEYRQSTRQHPLYGQPSYRHQLHQQQRHYHRDYQSNEASTREAPNNNGAGKERTTIKFISQLYFLLHLSVMLSLLLHHKSLVSSSHSRALDGAHLHTRSVPRAQEPSWSANSTVMQLPVPQMLQMTETQRLKAQPTLVNSVVVASTRNASDSRPTGRSNQSRFGRQTGEPKLMVTSADILVRLVGHWHASCALHYYLCYLLASSVVTLVFIRLARLFKSRRSDTIKSSRLARGAGALYVHGFNQQTRLDCTPVLIGSVSLGLIQLIVIGLDIASIVERTSDSRCSTYLPMLQFAFVSLLMQFILGRVAKNHEQKRDGGLAAATNLDARGSVAGALSINHSPTRDNNGHKQQQQQTITTTTTPDDLDCGASLGMQPANGGQNIALAHLLVTHILLWLMKLNSISLIQQPTASVISALADHNQLGPFGNEDQSSAPSSVQVWQQTSLSDNNNRLSDTNLDEGGAEQDNRTQLENILRRKIPTLPDHNKSSSINRPNITVAIKADWPSERPAAANSTAANATHMVNVQHLSNLTAKATSAGPSGDLLQPASVKNERDLGKLNDELLPIKSPREFSLANLSLTLNQTLEPSSSVSMSRAQLIQLLSLAAKGTFEPTRPPAPEPVVQVSGATPAPPGVFRSSLPKRMTAFRQTPRAMLTEAPRPAAKQVVGTSEPPKVRQKVARITVSRKEEPEAARVPLDELAIEEPIRLAKSLERPFPSVDHGEPLEHSQARKASGPESPPISKVMPAARPAPPIQSGDEPTEGEPPASSTEEPAGDEAELEALLPPVPNYAELADEEEAPARPNASEEAQPTLNLGDDGLVFNEAASSWNLTVVATSSQPLTAARSPPVGGPSFADYLLPIVHQYHILIIAILFNMWLNGLRPKRPRRRPIGQPSSVTSQPAGLDRFGWRRLPASWSSQQHWALYSSGSASSGGSDGEPGSSRSSRGLIAVPVRGKPAKTEPKWVEAAAGGLRARSVDSLQRRPPDQEPAGLSRASSLSRSARSASSERLLWLPTAKLAAQSNQRRRRPLAADSSLASSQSAASSAAQWRHPAARPAPTGRPVSSSVCSVFFGLLVVSGALIVIVLGADLLLVAAQCLGQLLSILVCLLGLCLIWRLRARAAARNKSAARRLARLASAGLGQRWLAQAPPPARPDELRAAEVGAQGHRQCFHYLFLLAAYFCGISIALNLAGQHSSQLLFSPQAVHFIERHLSWPHNWLLAVQGPLASYQLAFHALIALKGLLLILQVTLQTILIRSSCGRASSELRQIYTFLMFANLSLWALEICEQQQHLHRRRLETEAGSPALNQQDLVTLEAFTRFAASIVTLSHLYHGLVFMQH